MKINHRILSITAPFILLFCLAATCFSQVHYENFLPKHQLLQVEQDNTINHNLPQMIHFGFEDVTVNNLGVFATGGNGTGIVLLSNALTYGRDYISPVGWTFPTYSQAGTKSVALASNHNSVVAIAYIAQVSNSSNGVEVQIISAATGAIKINGSSILVPDIPDYSYANASSFQGNATISNIEAKMDERFVYVTWKQTGGGAPALPLSNQFPNATYFGFAIYDFQMNSFAVPAQLIKDPNGNFAIGESAPTVACNRWSSIPDFCRIAFPYIDQQDQNHIVHPAVFTPTLQQNQPNAVRLQDHPASLDASNNGQNCIWVRVVNFEEFEGQSGYHFFYAYYAPNVNNAVNPCLFSTNGLGQFSAGVIDDKLPLTTESKYPPAAVGNGYTDKSVYLIWASQVSKRTAYNQPRPEEKLKICRDFGINPIIVFPSTTSPRQQNFDGTFPDATYFLYYTLGCNQMGIYITYTLPHISGNGNSSYLIRASRPFAQHVRENTLVTGDCEITQNQFHNSEGERDVRVLPERDESIITGAPLARPNADTLRILAWDVNYHYIDHDDGEQYGGYDIYGFSTKLKYISTLGISSPPMLLAGMPSSADIPHQDPVNTWLYGGRGYIIMDAPSIDDYGNDEGFGPEIDFNNILGAGIGSAAHGGFEYNGTILSNMTRNVIGLYGFKNRPDTTELFKALAYFNAPCTIDHGSSLYSNKGQIRFKDATEDFDPSNPDKINGMKLLTMDGEFIVDSSTLILGGKNTGKTLEQIRISGTVSSTIVINSIITSGWENLSGYTTRPAGYCSEINLISPSGSAFANNKIYTTFINVSNPQTNFIFDANEIYDIRNALNLVRTPGSLPASILPITINNNTVHANFPHGNKDWNEEAIDFQVTHFRGINSDMEISGNRIIGNPSSTGIPFQANWTGIQIDQGTNAIVSSNTISDIGIGIFHEGQGLSIANLCSNLIYHCCPENGFGIVQDAGLGITKLNELHHNFYGYFAQGLIKDESTLLRNNIHDNRIGATFIDLSETKLNGLHTASENLAGMNIFDNNIDLGNGVTESLYQLWINSNNANVIAQPILGLISGTDDGTWGQNKFTSSQTFQYPIVHILYNGISSTMTLNNSIQLNDWTPTIPTSSSQIAASSTGLIINIDHFNEANKTASILDLECSADESSLKAHGKSSGLLSQLNSICDISSDDSLYLYIRAVNCWNGIDAKKALDTVRLYVERHPYATRLPGEVLSAMNHTLLFTNELPNSSKSDWIDNYNWLIKIMPLNSETAFQYTALVTIAGNLNGMDELNEAANMWWNISQWYPDTGSVSGCWREIRSIRHYQKEIPQDTTPFHKLTFPLQPLPGGTSGVNNNIATSVTFTIAPNPAKENTTAKISTTVSGLFTMQIYDLLGRKVEDVFSGSIEAGKRKINIDMKDLPSGEYYLRLGYPGGVKTVKLIHE
jgi:hypothetical protein